MPEGPSLVILKKEVKPFEGKKVVLVEGNSKQPIERIQGKKLLEVKTWGKHFILRFPKFSIRIHFMLFGKAAVNEKLLRPPRLSLQFSKGEINFYTCSVQFIDQPLDEVYDWSADVMNDSWDEKAARKKLKQLPDILVADALLDQNIFAGVGNIIKNEVMYRIKVHPENKIADLPAKKLTELIKEARNYSFDFLKWKKEFTLRKHWLAHTKKTCSRDGNPIIKKHIGKTNRRTFYCDKCQVRYGGGGRK
jgi:endonuclease VIII